MYQKKNFFKNAGVIITMVAASASAQTWQDISPAGVAYGFVALSNYGIACLAGAMPDQRKTLYAGTCADQGIWKSTDGGNSWYKASTGTNGSQIDGRNWSIAVDPTNSDIVYTNCGFGYRQGVWKSTDGGVDWTQIQGTIDNNDIQEIVVDPLNHLHILVTEHSGNYSLWESLDGGATWAGKGSPWGAHSGYVFFTGVDNSGNPSSSFWIAFSENNGAWRTEDAGNHWTQVSAAFSRSHAGAGLYRASSGALYGCVNNTIARSTDNGRTWIDLHATGNLPQTCDGYSGIVGDGTNIWTMPENTGTAVCGPYNWLITPENGNGLNWTKFSAQSFTNGPGQMLYDPINRVVYATCGCAGIWKLNLDPTPVTNTAILQHSIQSSQANDYVYNLQGKRAGRDVEFSLVNVRIQKLSNGMFVGRR